MNATVWPALMSRLTLRITGPIEVWNAKETFFSAMLCVKRAVGAGAVRYVRRREASLFQLHYGGERRQLTYEALVVRMRIDQARHQPGEDQQQNQDSGGTDQQNPDRDIDRGAQNEKRSHFEQAAAERLLARDFVSDLRDFGVQIRNAA